MPCDPTNAALVRGTCGRMWVRVAVLCTQIAVLYALAVGSITQREIEDAVFVNPSAFGDWLPGRRSQP
jgi:hypothetical protein